MAVVYGISDSEYLLVKKYPKSVRKFADIDIAHQELINELKKEPDGFFEKIKRFSKKRQLNKFKKNEKDPLQAGTKGERQVLEQLSKLSDNYFIICGPRIKLEKWLRYKGRRNLRSAQMDFVVVSRKGVILIEVKNWSDKYLKNNKFNPYEQTERAGKVLWYYLQSWSSSPSVMNILLPTRENMEYNRNYKHVFVINLENINHFIEERSERLNDKDVKSIVKKLKDFASG